MAKPKGGMQLAPLPQNGAIGAIGAIGAMTVRSANGRGGGRMEIGRGGRRGHGKMVTAVAVGAVAALRVRRGGAIHRRASHGGI